ncbi:MAG TPA: LacI family transcriptional regulator [Firmicutes bacterium]|jgi:simple sugar transport system substrate-binding protein|nr:LacI family transcriptional regulator [Bacillota bacterium]
MKKSLRILVISCLIGLLIMSAFTVSAAKKLEIPVIVKIIGIPWFNEFEAGVKKAAEKFGVNAYVVGPTQADPAQQVKMVEDFIAKGVNGIVVVPNDANALTPVFKKAQSKGIAIITNESPNQPGASWDIENIDNTAFGVANFKKMAELMGGKGEFAVFVGGLTVPLHNLWVDIGLDYLKKNYPNMKLVTDRIPCGEDADLSHTKTLELLQAYPNLKGIVSMGSLGPIGAAQAIREKGLIGKFNILGTVIPKQAAQYLKDGSLQYGYLWDPADSGYAAVYMAMLTAQKKKIGNEIQVPGFGKGVIDQKNKVVRFNAIMDINKKNVDSFTF